MYAYGFKSKLNARLRIIESRWLKTRISISKQPMLSWIKQVKASSIRPMFTTLCRKTTLIFFSLTSSNKINVSHKECTQIMDILFSGDQLSYQQFENFVLPQTNEKLKQYQKVKDEWKSNSMVERFTKLSIVQLLEKVLDGYRQTDKLRSILLENEGQHDIHQLWRLINERNPDVYGNLSEQGLKEFIEQSGAHWSVQEFKAILRYVDAKENQQNLSQSDFNRIVMPPLPQQSNAVFQYDKIQERIQQKYKEFGIQQVKHHDHEKEKISQHGYYNFRKVFDPLRDGRPTFDIDSDYIRQLKDYQERYCAPSKNPQLQYRHDLTGVRSHDFFFQDYYLYLHQQDQDQLFFNRFGKRYLYETQKRANSTQGNQIQGGQKFA